jgi:hypothetical protein
MKRKAFQWSGREKRKTREKQYESERENSTPTHRSRVDFESYMRQVEISNWSSSKVNLNRLSSKRRRKIPKKNIFE